MTTTDSAAHWLYLLRTEAQRTNIATVAKLLGYSRTSISLVLAGKYPGQTKRIADSVLKKLDRLVCPYLGEGLAVSECRAIATSAAPTHHPMKLSHWRACQRCPKRPQGEQP
ncbi:MAG: XRE family transcriptional regulator [Vogesella sp.]|uniref:XRE family transcriptional regulator n=1 Tax=Vogesella sp. TaxID=1904252 RepID=UPI003F34BA09